SRKSDDVLTKRQYDELIGLREALKQLSKESAQPDVATRLTTADPALKGLIKSFVEYLAASDKRSHYAKVQCRGKLLSPSADTWQIQSVGSGLLFGVNWNLNFGNDNERKALAREQEGKEVILTGNITADPHVHPTVNVETLKRAEK